MADEFHFERIGNDEVEALRRMGARQILQKHHVPFWKILPMANRVRRLMAENIEHIPKFEGIDELLQNKTALLVCIRQSWDSLTQAIAGRDLERFDPNGWALQDHLAHITEWERFILRNQLQGFPPHEALQIAPTHLEPFDLDRVNALLFERNRQRPVADVLADFHAVHAQLLAAVEASSEAELAKQTRIFDTETNPVLVWVLYNTHDHYEEHRLAFRSCVEITSRFLCVTAAPKTEVILTRLLRKAD